MRYITIPPDATIAINGETKSLTFVDLLVTVWTVDQKYGSCVETICEAIDVRKSFEDKKPGDVVQLADVLWERLRDVASKPTSGYNPAVMIHAVPLIHAVTKATDGQPK